MRRQIPADVSQHGSDDIQSRRAAFQARWPHLPGGLYSTVYCIFETALSIPVSGSNWSVCACTHYTQYKVYVDTPVAITPVPCFSLSCLHLLTLQYTASLLLLALKHSIPCICPCPLSPTLPSTWQSLTCTCSSLFQLSVFSLYLLLPGLLLYRCTIEQDGIPSSTNGFFSSSVLSSILSFRFPFLSLN